jgi:acyl-coenzyme A synthetase/AMP-(fatty) acid ligase
MVRERQATVEGDDIQCCYSTSGSTGIPKLVALPGRFTTNFFRTILMRNGVTGTDRLLTDRPMAYVGGHSGSIIGIGLTFIAVAAQTAGPRQQAGRDFFLTVLNEERANVVFVFSYMIRDFLKKAAGGSLDLRSVRIGLIGGEILQKHLVEQFLKFVPNIVNAYGATEDGLVLGTHIKDPRKKQIEHTGIGCDGEFKIIDTNGAIVPVGTGGELCVRNNYLLVKYWGDAEKTRDVKNESGWYKTNDLAVMDEEGYVTILGRRQELISKASIKIYPRSIEKVLLLQPLVENVVVVGIPHEVLFEEICLCYVGKNETATEDDIKQFCREMFQADEAGEGLLPDYVLRFDKFSVGSTDKTDRVKTKAEAIRRLKIEREKSRLIRN